MYHRFSTDIAVPAADVRVGDVVHSATCSLCGDVQVVLSKTEAPSGRFTITIGCADTRCGVAGTMHLYPEHVLSYSGTVALI